MKLLASRFGTLSRVALLIGSTVALELLASPLLPQAVAQSTRHRFTVTNTNDSGSGSLRQAVLDANASPGADEIVFRLSGRGMKTITLTAGQIEIADQLTIQGPGRDQLTLTGNNSRRLFRVNLEASVKLQDLTIANSRTSGGVIGNFGKLEIRNSAFKNNSGENQGTIENGSAKDSATDITLLLENVEFSNNTGKYGGAMINFATATLRLCTFDNNTSTWGGAIQNQDPATLRVDQSLFSQNKAQLGGGIFNQGALTVTNSGFESNAATNNGGGMFSQGTASVSKSNFQMNTAAASGGGIFSADGTVRVRKSQIRRNRATLGANVFGAVISEGGNSIGNATGSTGFGNQGSGDSIGSN